MIKFSNVTKSYAGFAAVRDISFSIEKGEIFAILGPNGAGKTTTLKMLCGLISSTSGKIEFNGSKLDKKIIGYMPEENALYESMHVREYLRFFAGLYDIDKDVAEKRIGDLLNMLELDDKEIVNLSKGMKRKLLLARSLINDPEVLVYDEPASGLDPAIARGLVEHIKQLKSHGKTIIISAHDLAQIEELADRIMILSKGAAEFIGTLDELKAKFSQPYVAVFSNGKKSFKNKSEMISYIKKHSRSLKDFQTSGKTLQEIFVERFKNG